MAGENDDVVEKLKATPGARYDRLTKLMIDIEMGTDVRKCLKESVSIAMVMQDEIREILHAYLTMKHKYDFMCKEIIDFTEPKQSS